MSSTNFGSIIILASCVIIYFRVAEIEIGLKAVRAYQSRIHYENTYWPHTHSQSTLTKKQKLTLLAHPRLEPAATDPEGTVVVEVPVDAGEGVRTARDLSMWEQLSFAAFLQRYWADNQASKVQLFENVSVPSRFRKGYLQSRNLSLPRSV